MGPPRRRCADAGLQETASPSALADGACPWTRYAEADRSNWGALFGRQLIVTDQSVARAILADSRFHQGIRVAMEQNPAIDPRFLARRKEGLLLRDGPDHARMRRLSGCAGCLLVPSHHARPTAIDRPCAR